MSTRFQRKIENFVCGHCGTRVEGNGYTNHCPKCLWSMHVDIYPGDRAETCGGLMEPVDVGTKKNDYILTHKCQVCGAVAHCTVTKDDDIKALEELTAALVKKRLF